MQGVICFLHCKRILLPSPGPNFQCGPRVLPGRALIANCRDCNRWHNCFRNVPRRTQRWEPTARRSGPASAYGDTASKWHHPHARGVAQGVKVLSCSRCRAHATRGCWTVGDRGKRGRTSAGLEGSEKLSHGGLRGDLQAVGLVAADEELHLDSSTEQSEECCPCAGKKGVSRSQRRAHAANLVPGRVTTSRL